MLTDVSTMLLVDGSKCFSTLLESFDAITTTPAFHRYKHTAVGLSHVSRSDRRHRCRYSRRAFGCGRHLGMYSFQQKRYVTAPARLADNEADRFGMHSAFAADNASALHTKNFETFGPSSRPRSILSIPHLIAADTSGKPSQSDVWVPGRAAV